MRVALLALVALARVARADVGVVVTGEPLMQAPVMAQVQGWLQGQNYQLIAAPFDTAMANRFIDCFVMEDMSCARTTFEESSKANSLVYMRVDQTPSEGGRDVAFTAYWFVKGNDPVMHKGECTNCADAAVATAIVTLMTELVKLVGDKGIAIEPAAVAPPPPPEAPVAPVESRSRALPAGLLVGGAAAAVAGGVFLYYGNLGGPDEPYIYTNATEIGAALTIAGAAAVIAGSVLWFRGSGTSGATVSIGATGAHVGWAGSF